MFLKIKKPLNSHSTVVYIKYICFSFIYSHLSITPVEGKVNLKNYYERSRVPNVRFETRKVHLKNRPKVLNATRARGYLYNKKISTRDLKDLL